MQAAKAEKLPWPPAHFCLPSREVGMSIVPAPLCRNPYLWARTATPQGVFGRLKAAFQPGLGFLFENPA